MAGRGGDRAAGPREQPVAGEPPGDQLGGRPPFLAVAGGLLEQAPGHADAMGEDELDRCGAAGDFPGVVGPSPRSLGCPCGVGGAVSGLLDLRGRRSWTTWSAR
jgi:hypothetical protein